MFDEASLGCFRGFGLSALVLVGAGVAGTGCATAPGPEAVPPQPAPPIAAPAPAPAATAEPAPTAMPEPVEVAETPAPEPTAPPEPPPELSAEAEQWMAVRQGAGDALARHQATITHDHAVGRVHRPWYDGQRPARFAEALRAAKAALDPAHMLNPGVLFDPVG